MKETENIKQVELLPTNCCLEQNKTHTHTPIYALEILP